MSFSLSFSLSFSIYIYILNVGNTEVRTSVAKDELSLAIFSSSSSSSYLCVIQISTTTEDIPEFDRTKVNLDIPPMVFGSGFTTITNISKILSNVITVSPSENSYEIKKISRSRSRSLSLYRREYNSNSAQYFFFLIFPPLSFYRVINTVNGVTLHFIAKLSRFSTIYLFSSSSAIKTICIRLNQIDEEWSFFFLSQNSARRTQTLLEVFKPFFRGVFAIKGLSSD